MSPLALALQPVAHTEPGAKTRRNAGGVLDRRVAATQNSLTWLQIQPRIAEQAVFHRPGNFYRGPG